MQSTTPTAWWRRDMFQALVENYPDLLGTETLK
jgi:hypothetical protein